MISDIRRTVDQISREKGIDQKILIDALEEALETAARRKFGTSVEIEVSYNEELGEIEVFQFKEVVEKVQSEDIELGLEEALELDPECEVGDSLGVKIDIDSFGRIAAQSAKQVIIQKLKVAERDVVYEDYVDRKGEVLNGIVQRIEKGNIIVNLGRTEGIVPSREQSPREYYRRGDRIRAYLLDVVRKTRGPQIVLSRSHPDFLTMLFKAEVPEISEGIIEIMGAAREAGNRAKIAVVSNDHDIDPVGACVGMKGSRVQSVVQELRGEKIDIIPWHADMAKFVCNALSPAEISRVIVDEQNKGMEVIVPDEYLSVAIGKGGQNVRLASKLTGWKIDVKSEAKYSKALRTGYESLLSIPGVTQENVDDLYEAGFYSVEELSKASVDELVQIKGIDAENGAALIEAAQGVSEQGPGDEELADNPDTPDEEPDDEESADNPEEPDDKEPDDKEPDDEESDDEEPDDEESDDEEPDDEEPDDEEPADNTGSSVDATMPVNENNETPDKEA
jgi:N utilization substance protein A